MTGVAFGLFLVFYAIIYAILDPKIITRRFFLVIFAIGFGCLFWQTEKRTKTIPINFEKASVLEGDEYQSFRLVLQKEKNDRKIDYKLSMTNGLFDTIETSNGFAGLGSTRYEIVRRSGGGRAPAVVSPEE